MKQKNVFAVSINIIGAALSLVNGVIALSDPEKPRCAGAINLISGIGTTAYVRSLFTKKPLSPVFALTFTLLALSADLHSLSSARKRPNKCDTGVNTPVFSNGE